MLFFFPFPFLGGVGGGQGWGGGGGGGVEVHLNIWNAVEVSMSSIANQKHDLMIQIAYDKLLFNYYFLKCIKESVSFQLYNLKYDHLTCINMAYN